MRVSSSTTRRWDASSEGVPAAVIVFTSRVKFSIVPGVLHAGEEPDHHPAVACIHILECMGDAAGLRLGERERQFPSGPCRVELALAAILGAGHLLDIAGIDE